MKLGQISATVAILAMFVGTAGEAQSRQRHEGFWIGFGIGGGVNASANNDERGGGALSLRLGGTLSQKFLLGGEISAWGRQEDSALGGDPLTVTKSNATFMVMFFPSDAGGFFIKGGIGGANVEAESAGMKVTEQGVGNTLGLGYDIRLGSNLYLTPNLDWLIQTFENDVGETTSNSLFLLTIGLTWH
jgi:hypothetical protein